MKKTIIVVLLLIAVILAASGCAKDGKAVDPANKFIGKWSDKKYSPDGSRWSEDSSVVSGYIKMMKSISWRAKV